MMTEDQFSDSQEKETANTKNTDQEINIEMDSPHSESEVSELEDLKNQLSEHKDKYLRLVAEFDNYKKRTVKERIDLIRNASQELIQELIVILDDFDRAKRISEEQKNEQIFPEGMRLVHQKLLGLLQSKGLEAMETTGKLFDPQNHEAITEIETSNADMKGKVFDTIEKGYLLNHKIIRFAKVVVAK